MCSIDRCIRVAVCILPQGDPEHVLRGLEAGSVDYVKKPFNRRELLSRIKAQIRSRCAAFLLNSCFSCFFFPSLPSNSEA